MSCMALHFDERRENLLGALRRDGAGRGRAGPQYPLASGAGAFGPRPQVRQLSGGKLFGEVLRQRGGFDGAGHRGFVGWRRAAAFNAGGRFPLAPFFCQFCGRVC